MHTHFFFTSNLFKHIRRARSLNASSGVQGKGTGVKGFRCDGKTITNDLLDTFYSLYLSGDCNTSSC